MFDVVRPIVVSRAEEVIDSAHVRVQLGGTPDRAALTSAAYSISTVLAFSLQ